MVKFVLLSSLLFLTGCVKEEVVQPGLICMSPYEYDNIQQQIQEHYEDYMNCSWKLNEGYRI